MQFILLEVGRGQAKMDQEEAVGWVEPQLLQGIRILRLLGLAVEKSK